MNKFFQWRTALPLLGVILPIMIGLNLYLIWFISNPLSNSLSIVDITLAIVIASLLLICATTAFIEYQRQPIKQLIRTVPSLISGKMRLRLDLVYGTEDAEQLARLFNALANERHRLAKKRNRERERWNTILAYMADGILVLTKNGKVRLINPTAERILKTSRHNVSEQTFVQVVRDHRIAGLWQRCQKSEREETEAFELDEERFVRVVVTPLLKGTARGYLVMLQDLTPLQRLQTIRQDFVSNVSHELRTPLASLKALAETLRDSALDDPPAARHFLDRMEVEVDALGQMVAELLELSRIESGQVPLRLEPTEIDKLIGASVERLLPQAGRAKVELEVDLADSLPELLVDAGRIQQVITNLVHNAIKFTLPDGHICVETVQTDDDFVTISVTDTGVGIPQEDLPRIFERFYKADRARSGGGTGLGLAIAKHIVQAHKGQIWVESVEGQGSCFYFSLPLATSL